MRHLWNKYSISCFCFCRRIAEQRCLSRIHQDSIFNRKCRISVFNRKCLQADAISKYIFSQCCQGCRNGNALNDTQLKKARSPMLFSDCEDGILLRETQSEKAELPIDCKESIAPMLVRVIAERAFYGCKSLETVTGGGNVQVIAPNAFSSCTALTSIGAMDSWYHFILSECCMVSKCSSIYHNT